MLKFVPTVSQVIAQCVSVGKSSGAKTARVVGWLRVADQHVTPGIATVLNDSLAKSTLKNGFASDRIFKGP